MTDSETFTQAIAALEEKRAALLASIEAEVAEIDALIAGLRRQLPKDMQAITPPVGTMLRPGLLTGPYSTGPYASMEFGEAARTYLLEVGEATTREIADALLAGGFKT